MGQIAFLQINRVNQNAGFDYASSVIQKLNNLPIRWRTWVEEQDDSYTETKRIFESEAPCGTPIGSETNPCLKDPTKPVLRDEDGAIDWDDPNILSPHVFYEDNVDYTKLDAIIMNAFEYAGLTYSEDPLEQDAGDTEEYIVERKKTPFRKIRIPDTEG